jgi:Flp pilus assembly pilin Flp
MKKTLLFILFPFLSFGQSQIGADIDGEAANDNNGYSVSLSSDGTTLAVGALNNDGINGMNSGSVRVYKNVSGVWTKIGPDIDGEAADDNSGFGVSLSNDGTTIAIGAYLNNGNGTDSGSVRVYKNVSSVWTKIGADIDGEAADDHSGYSVSLSDDGNVLAIGAYQNDGTASDAGSVRVYKNVSDVWTKIGGDINGEAAEDQSGNNISLSGDGTTIAIGAPGNDGNGIDSGSVRVYKNISDVWSKIGGDIDGEGAYDQSGASVTLSNDGTTIAIGAPYNNGYGSDSGSVRVYKNVSGVWTKIGSDIDGEATNDLSGGSVSMSDDGNTLAIGAYQNDGTALDSGSVRIYKNVSSVWIKKGSDINGEATSDYSGINVSLSNDGNTVAIGAPYNAGNGFNSGSVRIYNLSAVLSSDSFVLAHFSVYPNPASELVTISLQEDLTLEKVNIYNTLGQLVKTEINNTISVNSLTKGTYFFEVITDKGKATKTILVK